MKTVVLAAAFVAIQCLAPCESFEFRQLRCKQLNPYREPFSRAGTATPNKIEQELFLAEFAKFMSAKTPQLLKEFATIRKITDPLRDDWTDEEEEEREVSVVAPKNFANDNRRIRFGPAFEAVPTVGTRPRAFTHPLHKRLRFDVGDIFDSDCFPFCRVHPWGRRGRQMVEWSQPELREADLNALSSTTDAPTTTSTDAPTTASSTDAPTTAASSTEATTKTATTTTESTTQMPATTTASATTEKQHNVDTLVEQVLQILLDSPEDTASAVTQLIQELQEKFAPTTPAPTTIADKTFNVTSIIESIAGLGLVIENNVSEEDWAILCGPLWWPYHEEHCKEEIRCLACSPSVVAATAACKRAKSMGRLDVECVAETIGDGFCKQCAKKLYN